MASSMTSADCRAVGGVRVDRVAFELGRVQLAERGRELLARRPELVERHAGDGQEHAVGLVRSALVGLDGRLGREAVRADEDDTLGGGRRVRAEHRDLVADHLAAVLVDQAAEEDALGARRLDAVR